MAAPITAFALAMTALHKPPSAQIAQTFASFNMAAIEHAIADDVARFNSCLDSCSEERCTQYSPQTGLCVARSVMQGCESHYSLNTCSRFGNSHRCNHNGICYNEDRAALIANTSAAPTVPYGFYRCAPTKCLHELGTYTFNGHSGVQRVPLVSSLARYTPLTSSSSDHVDILANATTATLFSGTRLVFDRHALLSTWATLETVANIVSVCNYFNTYDNVSRIFELMNILPHTNGLAVPSIIEHRYPIAAKLLRTASVLRNTTHLCSVF